MMLNRATAFLFPGQGSQFVGMGKELARAEPIATGIFEQADEILGFSLSELCWEGPADELNKTINTQPALLTHSVAVLRALQHRFPTLNPQFTAGHSLGEISALVAAQVLKFEDALMLVRARGEAMEHAGNLHPGGMMAVLGLQIDEVEQACREAAEQVEGGVWVANDNCPGQIVISGDQDALEVVEGLLKEGGAKKVIRLAVSIAAHSPLMQPAQEHFNQALERTPFSEPIVPIIANGTALPLTKVEEIVADLAAQLTVRVRWTETIQYLIGEQVHYFLEVGSGNVLSGLLRRIDRSAEGYPIDTPASFENLPEIPNNP